MGKEVDPSIGEGLGCLLIALAIAVILFTVLGVHKWW